MTFRVLVSISLLLLAASAIAGDGIDDRYDLGAGSKVAFGARVAAGGDVYVTKNPLVFLELSALLTTFDLGDPTSTESLSLLYYISPQGGLQWRF